MTALAPGLVVGAVGVYVRGTQSWLGKLPTIHPPSALGPTLGT